MLDFGAIFIYNIGAIEKSTQKHTKPAQALETEKTKKGGSSGK